MPQTCKICIHKKRVAIEKQLLAQVPLRNIAKQFDVSVAALNRHKTGGHISTTALAKREDRKLEEARSIDEYLTKVRERLEELYQTALVTTDKDGNARIEVALGCLREMKSIALDVAKMKLDEFRNLLANQQQLTERPLSPELAADIARVCA